MRVVDYKTGIMPDSKKLKSDYDTDLSIIFSPAVLFDIDLISIIQHNINSENSFHPSI